MNYWESLTWQSRRNILLWLYVLKTEPIEEITGSFLEPKWIDVDPSITAHRIPDYIFMMTPKLLIAELNENGGPPSWTFTKKAERDGMNLVKAIK